MPPATLPNADTCDDPAHVASLLLKRKVDDVTRAGTGGNSRIYRVRADGASYALKMYPASKNDPRDRLGTEKKALRFFERHGIANVPRWINDCTGYGLLSWIEGETPGSPTPDEMKQAIAFIGDMKRLSLLPEASDMPPASEACASGGEILHQIEQRLARLQQVAQEEPAVAVFLERSFVPAFVSARTAAMEKYSSEKLIFDAPLQRGLCLIPADFGFGNALRGANGITFVDFEYFGWDDPVKLTADFLLHPAMELSNTARDQFKKSMLALFAEDPHFALRLRALTPLFALRWALILLNEFLPERWSGRAFAQGKGEWAEVKTRQLAKAETMVKHINNETFHA